MSITSVTVSPAYGRDYKDGAEAVKDWQDGKDFEIQSIFPIRRIGKYISIRDIQLPGNENAEVRIRYKRTRQYSAVDWTRVITLTHPVNTGGSWK